MHIEANQPGAKPFSIPESVPNPAVRELPARREAPRREKGLPVEMPEKVPA